MSTLKVNSIQSFTGAAPVVLNDEVGISGSLQVSGNFMPNAGGTHALGTMANSWGSLHVHGLGHIHTASINVVSGNLLPDTGSTYALGTMAKSWGSLHVHGLAHIHTASVSFVSGNLIPNADDLYDLGSSAKQWKDLHLDGIAFIDSASVGTASFGRIASSFKPNVGNIYDIGSHLLPFRNLFIDGTGSIDHINAESVRIDAAATASGVDLASATPSVNGGKVTVQAITAAQINDGAFAQFNLLNTKIASDSVVVCSFNGNHSNTNMSGSILTARVIGTSTASIFIHNETGATIGADTPFTASFVVL